MGTRLRIREMTSEELKNIIETNYPSLTIVSLRMGIGRNFRIEFAETLTQNQLDPVDAKLAEYNLVKDVL